MSCPIEIEFAANLGEGGAAAGEFALLQIRPLAMPTAAPAEVRPGPTPRWTP